MTIKRIISLMLAMLLVLNIAVFSASAYNSEVVQTGSIAVEITSYEQLKKLIYNSPNGEIYVLQNDIVVEDSVNDAELVVGTFSDCKLDLNGYTLLRKTRGLDSCLIEIKEGGSLTILDSSKDKSGKLSFESGFSAGINCMFLVNGDLDIYGGNYEITTQTNSPSSGTVFMVEKGYLDIYDGVFDSHNALGGDSITLWHPAYLYTVPHCNVYGGTFYAKYSTFDVSAYGSYTSYGCPYPTAYVFGGEFYIANPDDEYAGFAYCNNGFGRVIVAGGRVFYKCLNSRDQIFLEGVSKTLVSAEYEGNKGAYYDVKIDCYVAWEGARFAESLYTKCQKKEFSYYGDKSNVYIYNKEVIDNIRSYVDTIDVPETQDYSPLIWIENANNIKTTEWYFSDSAFYDGENTPWVELPDYRGKVNPFRFDFRPKDETTLYIRALITKDDGSVVEEIFAIHYEEEKLNPAITNVSINKIDEPKVGNTPDFSVDTASKDYYINAFYWTDVTTSKTMKESDVFEMGHTYELQVWLRTEEGYKFQTDSDGYIDITATIGGKPAEVAEIDSEISALLTITYTLNAPQVVSFVDIGEVDEPVAGAAPDLTAYCYTKGCNVETVEWFDITDGVPELMKDGEKFVSGRIYRVVVGVRAEGNYTYEMFDGYNEATAAINGERANASGSHDEDYAEFFYNFAPCKGFEGLLGDVDGDGKVTIMDATLIQLHIAQLETLTDIQLKAADTDKNSNITIMDATQIQLLIAQLIEEF